jgi:hypothetical protein
MKICGVVTAAMIAALALGISDSCFAQTRSSYGEQSELTIPGKSPEKISAYYAGAEARLAYKNDYERQTPTAKSPNEERIEIKTVEGDGGSLDIYIIAHDGNIKIGGSFKIDPLMTINIVKAKDGCPIPGTNAGGASAAKTWGIGSVGTAMTSVSTATLVPPSTFSVDSSQE